MGATSLLNVGVGVCAEAAGAKVPKRPTRAAAVIVRFILSSAENRVWETMKMVPRFDEVPAGEVSKELRALKVYGLALFAALALARNLASSTPRLAETNRDRLFAAGDLLARAARPERAAFALMHRPLHFALSLLAVFRHVWRKCK